MGRVEQTVVAFATDGGLALIASSCRDGRRRASAWDAGGCGG